MWKSRSKATNARARAFYTRVRASINNYFYSPHLFIYLAIARERDSKQTDKRPQRGAGGVSAEGTPPG